LLVEIRRRAVRNAAHVATATGVAVERGLVDDVLLAAWLVLRRHGDKVLAAACPWAYLMSSAQKQVLDEGRAQQLLTNPASIRGRAREVLPSTVRPVGSTATDLAAALRHEPSDADDARRIVHQVRQHEQPPLVAGSELGATPPLCKRQSWFAAFIDLLVANGADQPSPWPPRRRSLADSGMAAPRPFRLQGLRPLSGELERDIEVGGRDDPEDAECFSSPADLSHMLQVVAVSYCGRPVVR
jgi:hypothetical protein